MQKLPNDLNDLRPIANDEVGIKNLLSSVMLNSMLVAAGDKNPDYASNMMNTTGVLIWLYAKVMVQGEEITELRNQIIKLKIEKGAPNGDAENNKD